MGGMEVTPTPTLEEIKAEVTNLSIDISIYAPEVHSEFNDDRMDCHTAEEYEACLNRWTRIAQKAWARNSRPGGDNWD